MNVEYSGEPKTAIVLHYNSVPVAPPTFQNRTLSVGHLPEEVR